MAAGNARKARIETLFASSLYRAKLNGSARLSRELEAACLSIAAEDKAGQRWCREHSYKGYTSYASLDDLPRRASVFADLAAALDLHARAFARALDFDLAGSKLALDSLWINVLKPGGHHTAHIHPHSVLSGSYYVRVPDGAGAIRFEDPRLAMMMAAPPRRANARAQNRTFVSVAPEAGTVLMWESWLRHEVPANAGRAARISLSFNYAIR